MAKSKTTRSTRTSRVKNDVPVFEPGIKGELERVSWLLGGAAEMARPLTEHCSDQKNGKYSDKELAFAVCNTVRVSQALIDDLSKRV